MTHTTSLPLADFAETYESLAAVGRLFGVTGQGISKALADERDIRVVIDLASGRPIEAIEIKKLWRAVDNP